MFLYIKKKARNILLSLLDFSYHIGSIIWSFFEVKTDRKDSVIDQSDSAPTTLQAALEERDSHLRAEQEKSEALERKNEELMAQLMQQKELEELRVNDKESQLFEQAYAINEIRRESDTELAQQKRELQEQSHYIAQLTEQHNQLHTVNVRLQHELEGFRAQQQIRALNLLRDVTPKIDDVVREQTSSQSSVCLVNPNVLEANNMLRSHTTQNQKTLILSPRMAHSMILSSVPLCLFSLGYVSQYGARDIYGLLQHINLEALKLGFRATQESTRFNITWDVSRAFKRIGL